jgi:DNA-binding transcriptional regulator YhcF (GntR family)
VIVRVDPASAVPVFEQLRSQLERLIVLGRLAPGTQLPAIRHLAADLGIAPGTVAKVYEALARAGLVDSARRRGTTVAPSSASAASAEAARAGLDRAAEALALAAHQAGLTAAAAREAVDRAWSRLAGEAGAGPLPG